MTAKKLMIAALMIAVLGGCIMGGNPDIIVPPADMTADKLVGVWKQRGADAELQFAADSGFSATNLPFQKFEGIRDALPEGFDPHRDKLPATGEWELRHPIGKKEGPRSIVHLRLRMLAGRPSSGGVDMRAEEIDSGPVILTFYLGDPDLNNKVVYEKTF